MSSVLTSIAVLAWASRYVRSGSIEATRNLLVDPPNLREWTPDPAYTFVRRQLPPDATVLLLNTNHGFFWDRDYVSDSFFEASQLNEAITAAGDREGITRLFERLGVTHVVIHEEPWVPFPPILWSYIRDSDDSRLLYRTPDSSLTVYRTHAGISTLKGLLGSSPIARRRREIALEIFVIAMSEESVQRHATACPEPTDSEAGGSQPSLSVREACDRALGRN